MTRKILIVEDNDAHMGVICKIIRDLNKDIELFCAANGHDAYTIALGHHIHLFLVDIILNAQDSGDVSGLHFVQEIRSIKKYAFVPVIFISSLEDPKLYSYSQLNCFGYIEKPFDEKQVKKYVLKALEFPIVDDEDRFVYFRKDGIIYSKRVSEIAYIENSRRRIVVHCINDELEIPYKTCDKIMEELDSNAFIQCSRYVILNKAYIEQIDYVNRYVKLKGMEKRLEIGVIMKKRFKGEMEQGAGVY